MRIRIHLPIIFIITIHIFFANLTSAATINALSSGKWETNARWSGGQTPVCGDTIIIGAGLSIEVTSMLEFPGRAQPMHLIIHGTLAIQTGKQLRLPCGSSVTLTTSGLITAGSGGGKSNLIDICNITVWNAAQGTLEGPLALQLNPLPIELAYFSVRPEAEGITISWITLSEKNNNFFTVEKGRDGSDFDDLITIDGAGTTSHLSSYEVTNMNPFDGVQYYRLRQTDFDGKSSVSKTIAVNWDTLNRFQIYPNPTRGDLFANIDSHLKGQMGKLIVNKADGKLVLLKEIHLNENTYGLRLLSGKEFLKPGQYLVSLHFKDHNYTQLVIAK